jgi:hypothetical protein
VWKTPRNRNSTFYINIKLIYFIVPSVMQLCSSDFIILRHVSASIGHLQVFSVFIFAKTVTCIYHSSFC